MDVVLLREAQKEFNRLNEPILGRIAQALKLLEAEPPEGDIKSLEGRSEYRVRVGGYRIIYGIKKNRIVVLAIKPRGQVYKGGRK